MLASDPYLENREKEDAFLRRVMEAIEQGLRFVPVSMLSVTPPATVEAPSSEDDENECFRIMKTDFLARPVYLQDENRIKAHFLICFLALIIYRFLEKKLNYKYTCEELLETLKSMNFAGIQEQGYIPLYKRETITDDLHDICGFRTDYQFITKSTMRTIQKKSKGKE